MTTKNFSVKTEFEAVDRLSSKVRTMESSVGRFTRGAISGIGSIQHVTGKVDAALKKVGASLLGAGAVAGMAAKSIIGAGADFDQQMADLGAVSLQTRDQIKPLEDEAKRLGATTKFTATEVGQGMELMAKAGFTTTDILAGISGVMAAAAAEGADLADTTSHISNVLKGMGLETSQAGHVADVLALAAARTNASIGSLGESMANVASTARTFNIPLESVVASVALLQDVGLDASVAGSAMNTMLTKLAKPTDDMAGKMRRMGVKFQDAKGNMLPLESVLLNFAKAMEKSGGNMKQVAFFADLVGLRGQKAAQNLADMIKPGDDGQSKLVKLMEELSSASSGVGKATEMADLRMKGFHGRMDLLSSAVDAVKVRIFDLNSGPLKGLIDKTTEWVSANEDLVVSKIQSWVTWLINNFDTLVHRMKQIGKAVAVFYALNTALKVTKFTLEAFQLLVKAWPFAVKAASIATKLWNVEIATLGTTTAATGTQLDLFTAKATRASSAGKLLGTAAGIAGAAFAGWEIGKWLNETYDTDRRLRELFESATGLSNLLRDREGGKKGLDTKGGRVYGKHQSPEQIAKDSFESSERDFKGMPMNAAMRRNLERMRRFHGVSPQVVTPGERTTRSIQETNERSTVDVVITDKTGKAEVKKSPRIKGVNVKLAPSGAF